MTVDSCRFCGECAARTRLGTLGSHHVAFVGRSPSDVNYLESNNSARCLCSDFYKYLFSARIVWDKVFLSRVGVAVRVIGLGGLRSNHYMFRNRKTKVIINYVRLVG